MKKTTNKVTNNIQKSKWKCDRPAHTLATGPLGEERGAVMIDWYGLPITCYFTGGPSGQMQFLYVNGHLWPTLLSFRGCSRFSFKARVKILVYCYRIETLANVIQILPVTYETRGPKASIGTNHVILAASFKSVCSF